MVMNIEPVFRGRNFQTRKDLCFVLMPLHDPFTSIFDRHIKRVVRDCSLVAMKADDIYSNRPVMEDVWTHLNQARLVIADLTDSNPNVFYELGIAHTLGKDVIMIAQHLTKVPFDVGHVRYINYVYPSQVERFEVALRDTISQVVKDSKVELRAVGPSAQTKIREENPTFTNLRVQRLNSLTVWSREWVAGNYPNLIDGRGHYLWNLSSWDIFETITSTIRTEAVKRWSLSSGTAKDYADAVMLTIEPEFKKQIELAVGRWNDKAKEQRREEEEREAMAKETFQRLGAGSRPVKSNDFYDALVKTGKFTRQQAETQLDLMKLRGTVYEVSPGDYRKTRYGP